MGAATITPALQAANAKKPNFVVILADDMGFSDARCGPSRSSLLTGYYAQQTASDVMTPGNVPSYTRFLPDHLKPLGYRSYTLLDENRYFTQPRHELDSALLPKPDEGYYSTIAVADYAVRFL